MQTELEISISEQSGYANNAAEVIFVKAREAFDSLGSIMSDAVEPLRQKLIETASSADEVELKLDLALKADSKWVVMSMEGGATVSVKLVWKKK